MIHKPFLFLPVELFLLFHIFSMLFLAVWLQTLNEKESVVLKHGISQNDP